MQQGLLTTREAAAYLALHPKTVQDWARWGRLPCIRVGGHWRFRKAELDEWIAQGCPRQQREPSLFDQAAPEQDEGR
jgi:excisionase family DNA binding protein